MFSFYDLPQRAAAFSAHRNSEEWKIWGKHCDLRFTVTENVLMKKKRKKINSVRHANVFFLWALVGRFTNSDGEKTNECMLFDIDINMTRSRFESSFRRFSDCQLASTAAVAWIYRMTNKLLISPSISLVNSSGRTEMMNWIGWHSCVHYSSSGVNMTHGPRALSLPNRITHLTSKLEFWIWEDEMVRIQRKSSKNHPLMVDQCVD